VPDKKRWSFDDATQLRDHLGELLGVQKLRSLWRDAISNSEKGFEELHLLRYPTLHRWADYEARRLHNLSNKLPELLFDYLTLTKAFGSGTPGEPNQQAFARSAGAFFQTVDAKFNQSHLRALQGNFIMYRRYWRIPDNRTFMTSHVSIRLSSDRKTFGFSEHQYWLKDKQTGEKEWIEVDNGFMFPSGNSILTVCRSTKGNTTKFLSISKVQDVAPHTGEKINSFSGTGIASSDVPPHVGYGFHCIRETEVHRMPIMPKEVRSTHKDRDYSRARESQSQKLTADDLNNRNIDILREILYHEGYRNEEIFPTKGDT
jgi:hypothetical protein